MEERDQIFGSALRLLRYREDLGFGAFNTVTSGQRERRYPDFLIIGAQKAGTTWLYTQLGYHPNIWLSPAKELNYFNEVYHQSEDRWEAAGRSSQATMAREALTSLTKLSHRQRLMLESLNVIDETEISDDWYGRIFASAPAEDLCGEASPEYCVLPRAGIAHIAALNPSMKAIIVVRDPIDRAWSHIRMATRNGYGSESYEFLADDYVWRGYQGRSNYPEMFRRWRNVFGADQVIVLNYDLIVNSPLSLLKSLCDRLGLMFDPRFFHNTAVAVGSGGASDMPPEIYEMAKGRMRQIYDSLWNVMPAEAEAWIARHYYGDGPRPVPGQAAPAIAETPRGEESAAGSARPDVAP